MAKETYRLGSFLVPISRLNPNSLNDLKTLYQATVGLTEIPNQDIAKAWSLSSPNSGGFYRRLNSLILYGLLQPASKGKFKITQLGKDILFPYSEDHKKQSYKKAVLNVDLWSELYRIIKNKNPPDSIFSHLRTITHAEPIQIEKAERDIRRWYLEDISLIPDEILQEKDVEQTQQKEFSSQEYYNHNNGEKSMLTTNQPPTNSQSESEEYSFENGKVLIRLPKDNKTEVWSRVKQVLDIYMKIPQSSSQNDKNQEQINKRKDLTMFEDLSSPDS
jgi:hypothetical protein